jgi:pimeloyl-ACP methyl ester carboxylesterase
METKGRFSDRRHGLEIPMRPESLRLHRRSLLAAHLILVVSAAGCASSPGAAGSPIPGAVTASTSAAPTAPPTMTGSAASPGAASVSPEEVKLIADVDVDGGRKIHVSCVGTAPDGAPTVVFVAGLGAPAEAANPIVYGVAAKTRVCAYDRAGLGQSDPIVGPAPSAVEQVADLESALDGAGVPAPYILVGHSYGAYLLAVATRDHPNDVVGLVFADPRGPRVSARWLAALPPASADEDRAIAANRDELTTGEADASLNPEGVDLSRSAKEAVRALDAPGPLFGERPVVVLGAGRTKEAWSDLPDSVRTAFDAIWLDEQKDLAEESRNGVFHSIADSDHDLVGQDPDAVIAAIDEVLAAVRAGG